MTVTKISILLSIATVRGKVPPMKRSLVIGVSIIKVIIIGKFRAIVAKILIEIVPWLIITLTEITTLMTTDNNNSSNDKKIAIEK